MRRHLLGILAIAGIVSGLGMLVLGVDVAEAIPSSLWRIGLVLGALWMAFPDLDQMARWFRRAVIVVAVVAAALHRYAPVLLPLIFLMWLLGKRKPDAKDVKRPEKDGVG